VSASARDNEAFAPKASVLVVTYNHERYVRQALDSVLGQDAGFTVEVVIADDGSTDSTVARIREHPAAADIRLLPSDRNLGMTRNYQRGFAACRGEYVAVLEGDDVWISPGKLRTSVGFLDRRRECPLCFHRLLLYDERTGCFTVRPPPEATQRPYFAARDLARDNFIGNFSACVYRRDAIRRLDPALYGLDVSDWMFNIAMARQGCIGYVPEIMSVYRLHPGGTWSSQTPEEQWQHLVPLLHAYDEHLGFAFSAEFAAFQRAFVTAITATSRDQPRSVYRRLRRRVGERLRA
jgi:glycosyltransferase involved in cell wall biosynthesis